MIVPQQSGITVTEGIGYREVRWRSGAAKPIMVVLALIVLMMLGAQAYTYVSMQHSSAATQTNPMTIFLPMAVFQVLTLVAFIVFFLRRFAAPEWLRLYDDRLELKAMSVMTDEEAAAPTVSRGQVRQLAKSDLTDVTLSDGQARHLRLETTQGTLTFGYLLPAHDLTTLAQVLGGWLG